MTDGGAFWPRRNLLPTCCCCAWWNRQNDASSSCCGAVSAAAVLLWLLFYYSSASSSLLSVSANMEFPFWQILSRSKHLQRAFSACCLGHPLLTKISQPELRLQQWLWSHDVYHQRRYCYLLPLSSAVSPFVLYRFNRWRWHLQSILLLSMSSSSESDRIQNRTDIVIGLAK